MFIGILLIVLILLVVMARNKQKKIARLKDRYEQTLLGTDKRAALDAGRAYYSALRQPKQLTIYNEQAITNDLATMKGR